MSLAARLLALWKDPVGSNIIAGAVIAGATYLYVWLVAGGSSSSMLAHPIAKIGIPGLALILLLFLWHHYRNAPKIVVFLSTGGTCRDPIAKAITTKLLEQMKPRPRIEIHAAGLGPSTAEEASYAARYVIREMYGEDLLKDHRPTLLTPDLVARADLILAMDRSLLLTQAKTCQRTRPMC